MGYYRAGDYYRRGDLKDTIGNYLAKNPDILSGFQFGKGGLATAQPDTSMLPSHTPNTNILGAAGLAAGGRKRRRMNPLNPRALRRAYSRLSSASKWAHRLFTLARPHHGVRAKFHRKRSR